jgi:type VI protein secretion system component VasF
VHRDWVDLRSFGRWRGRFGDELDSGVAKLIANFYDLPEQFLPDLRREEQRQRYRTERNLFILGSILIAALALVALVQWRGTSLAQTSEIMTRAELSVHLA